MLPTLRWTEHAVDQLGAIAEYVGRTSSVYADRLIERLVTRLEQARSFPHSGRAVPEWHDPEVRELIDAPYRLIYRNGTDSIEVVAIVHVRQQLEPRP